LLRAAAWQVWKRVTGRPWDVAVSGSVRIRCHPDSTSASLVLYCGGLPDFHEMTFMRRYLRPGDAFLDVGANVGVYSLLAADLVGPDGRVEAVEPDATAAARLRENVARNGLLQVHVHECAAADRDGAVEFLQGRGTQNRISAGLDAGERTSVPAIRLDELIGARRFAMGKMDIEGAEPLALRGASPALAAANPPVWLLEFTGLMRAYGFSEEGVAGWLRERGYGLAVYDARSRVLRFGERVWQGCANVFAIAERSRSLVEGRLDRG
jgi:FkbM family methyltransferase